MRTAIIALVALCLAECLVFLGLYGWRAPWWRSAMGRHLMSFIGTLAGLFGLVLAGWLFGPLPRIVWVAGLAMLAVVLGHRILLLIRAQRGT